MRRLVGSMFLIGGALSLASCTTDVHGVTVTNQTEHIVRAELIQLRKDGEMTTYSSQIVGLGGEFKNIVAAEDYRRGMRVRFTLADQDYKDGNYVLLNLPDKKDRVYDLVLIGPRLSAREYAKGRAPKPDQ